MNKKKKFSISKKTIVVLLFIITIVIVSYSFVYFIKSNSLLKYKNNKISFSYDSSWAVSKLDESIYLTKKNGSSITISIVDKSDELINMSIDDINDNIISKMMNENENYKKLADKKLKLTSVYYDGYKTLFENNTSEALVFVISTSDYVVIVNYTAKNKYFDMSIDSVESIVGSMVI